jgi:hypothetical protein
MNNLHQQQILLNNLQHDSESSCESNNASTLSTDSSGGLAEGQDTVQSLKTAETSSASPLPMKPTFSETTMNSHLLNALPKYIFQTDHAALKSVSTIIKEVKEKQSREEADSLNRVNSEYEVGEYPIEFLENQQHAIERHMSIR